MSTTSRRRFLKSAAAAAAVTAAGCGPTTPPPPAPGNASGATSATGAPGAPAPAPAALAASADHTVAANWLGGPQFLNPTLASAATSSFVLYGLLCADFSGKELLVPNSGGLAGQGVHQHTPKLWLHTARVIGGSASADGTIAGFSWWNITNWNLKVEALDNAGTAIAPTSGPLAWRDDDRHPWTNQKWVRCLKDVTNKNILANRDDTTLVSARMAMPVGALTAISPTTNRGRNTVWQQTKHDSTKKENATTDSMAWQVQYPGTPATYRITLTKMGDSTTKKVVNVDQRDKSLLAAITSAMNMNPANPLLLTDTKAFARLLTGGNPATYDAPTAISALSLSASGSDGHCECACN